MINGTKILPLQSQQCELNLTIQISPGATSGVRLAAGNGHELEIGYNAATQTLYIDRSKTANQSFNTNFEKLSRYETKLDLAGNILELSIFFDHSIVEVFANLGEAALTAQLFPDEKDNGIELFSKNGSAKIISLKAWKMQSAW